MMLVKCWHTCAETASARLSHTFSSSLVSSFLISTGPWLSSLLWASSLNMSLLAMQRLWKTGLWKTGPDHHDKGWGHSQLRKIITHHFQVLMNSKWNHHLEKGQGSFADLVDNVMNSRLANTKSSGHHRVRCYMGKPIEKNKHFNVSLWSVVRADFSGRVKALMVYCDWQRSGSRFPSLKYSYRMGTAEFRWQ